MLAEALEDESIRDSRLLTSSLSFYAMNAAFSSLSLIKFVTSVLSFKS